MHLLEHLEDDIVVMSSESGHAPKFQHMPLIVFEPQHRLGKFFFEKGFIETDFEEYLFGVFKHGCLF